MDTRANLKTVSRPGDTYCFERFRLETRERVLLKDNSPVGIGSRAFDLLQTLLERAGDTVNRQELFTRVWPDVVVSKVNLRVHVAALRRVLGEGQDGNRFIVSVASRGYRFVAPVSRLEPAVSAAALQRHQAALLPARLECLFRRRMLLATLSSQLSKKRFICVGGPAGSGHTGAAFAIAHTLAIAFHDEICFVDLCGTVDPALVPKAVADALRRESVPHEALSCLLGYLRDKEMLLVIDNCDHVLTAVAQLTEQLFTAAPLVHVIVTSREALYLSRAVAPQK